MVEILYLNTTTVGQLFNFLNVIASLMVLVNSFFDIDYRISKMTHFEDNIGIVIDIVCCIAAFVVGYYSLLTPYDNLEVTTKATENFRTTIYMLSLHIAAQATVVDNPALIFSTAYELIGDVTDGSIVDTGDVTYIESTSISFLTNINKYFLEAIYYSKTWLTIAGIIYSAYVIRANKPDFGESCRVYFIKTSFGRIPSIIITSFALYQYIINVDFSPFQKYSDILFEQTSTSATFESISVFFLGLKIVYILIFWKRYEFCLPAIFFIVLNDIL